jgi:hypothetical protein
MIPMEGMAYRRLNDIQPGNLTYYVEGQAAPVLALRIKHSGCRQGTEPYSAALILSGDAGGLRMPLVDATKPSSYYIDLGAKPLVAWNVPLSAAPRSTRENLPVGYLLLTPSGPWLSGVYLGGRGDLMYWDLSTGEVQSIGDQEFTFITEWSIGLADTSGLFCRLVTYPADFRTAGT